ncbi:MAG TPA: PDZ domain-containing protein [Nocardioides sp.]|nr:PDZ domain-containing protein [Nocardioides sp.]
MSKRLIAVCIAGALTLVLGGLTLAVPLPYGSYSPGPTFDILGKDSDHAELVQVDGHEAYYDKGQIRFTTVIASAYGDKLTLADALARWLDPHRAVVPYELVHPPDQSAAEEESEGAVQMDASQGTAKAMALEELGYDVKPAVQVALVDDSGPAKGQLLPHDVFEKVDGKAVKTSDDVVNGVRSHKDGSAVTFTVRRDKRLLDVKITPKTVEGTPRVGVSLGLGYEYPFTITLRVDPTVGGPSAGLMFSLAIYDTLTPGSLTGGATVAGTGELRADGTVGPIGGIAQKIAGAEKAGAKLFFVPKDNCPDVADVETDMRLVKATDVHEARTALEKWAGDHDAKLPTC